MHSAGCAGARATAQLSISTAPVTSSLAVVVCFPCTCRHPKARFRSFVLCRSSSCLLSFLLCRSSCFLNLLLHRRSSCLLSLLFHRHRSGVLFCLLFHRSGILLSLLLQRSAVLFCI